MLEFVRLRFEAEVVQGGTLPRFWGPTLRGALGLTFRKMVCVTHLDDCAPCLLRFQCPFPRFFEPYAPPDHPLGKRLAQMPRPFVLEVPPPAPTPVVTLGEGEPLTFRVTLWQHAETLLPYLVITAQRALDRGLGKSVRARLHRVVAEHPDGECVVFDSGERLVTTKFPLLAVDRVMATPAMSVRRLTVRFLTPVRVDIGGRLQNPVTFPVLVKAANERGRSLFWAYEGIEPPWDGKALVRMAEMVAMTDSEQQWLDLQRYSRRQQERLKVGGVIGWATFEGDDLTPFIPLLRLMEWVHVGKAGTMGLGHISLALG